MMFLGYIQFIVKEVPDTSPQLLDNVLRILLQLLSTWRNSVITATHRSPQDDPPTIISVIIHINLLNCKTRLHFSFFPNRNLRLLALYVQLKVWL